ncbi:MAG: phosphoribosyltransferase family protein [Pseudomonadota bacterium]
MTVDERFANMLQAIAANPKAGTGLAGREVCLIDDVMTSGATLTAATEVLYDMGAARVYALVLARVEKAP